MVFIIPVITLLEQAIVLVAADANVSGAPAAVVTETDTVPAIAGEKTRTAPAAASAGTKADPAATTDRNRKRNVPAAFGTDPAVDNAKFRDILKI